MIIVCGASKIGVAAIVLLLQVPSCFSWRAGSSSSVAPSSSQRRRQLLGNAAIGVVGILTGQQANPEIALAIEEGEEGGGVTSANIPSPPTPTSKKPFAPIEQLVPATRVKWTIDEAVEIATSAAAAAANAEKDSSTMVASSLQQLDSLLLVPQNFTADNKLPDIPTAPAKAYLDTYQRNRQQLNVLARPGAALVQTGEIGAWKRLKRQERALEEQDEIRAAFNMYTTSLNYNAESYLLNVPAAERKQMIRQDQLPDIKQVIQSDMGVRYLLRNELLTTMDEVRGELTYQQQQFAASSNKNNNDTKGVADEDPSCHLQDLVTLLLKAQDACNQWFALIDSNDVQEALRLVKLERS